PAAPPAIPPWAYMGWMPPMGAMNPEQMPRTMNPEQLLLTALGDPVLRERLRSLLLESSTTSTPKSTAAPQPMPAAMPPMPAPVVPLPVTATRAGAVEPPVAPLSELPMDVSREMTEAEFQELFQNLPADMYAAVFKKKEGT